MVDHVEVYKGPYFVQFGDFNTAGAVNIVTKRRDKDTTFTITGGSYNQQRYLGILSPPEGTPLTPYIGFEAYHDLGPFKNPENFNRFNLMSKFSLVSTANSNLNLIGTFFKSYWNASGEIPARESRSSRTVGRDRQQRGRKDRTPQHQSPIQLRRHAAVVQCPGLVFILSLRSVFEFHFFPERPGERRRDRTN